MGFWGTEPCDNDVAEDGIDRLSESGPSPIEETLRQVEYAEGDDYWEALATAELISGAGGPPCRGPRASYFLNETEWVIPASQSRWKR